MKKFLVILAALMVFLFAACGAAAQDGLCGTWNAVSIEMDGSEFTLEELKALGDESISDLYVVLKDGGKAYIYADDDGGLVDWSETDTGVKIGIQECTMIDGVLCLEYNDVKVYLEKASDSQTIPSNFDAGTNASPDVVPSASPLATPSADLPASEDPPLDIPIIPTDLTPSSGFEFESNGDGTCSITGIGVCTDTDIVIPAESPAGDKVTAIAEDAFWGIDDIDSVAFANCAMTVESSAFSYGKFERLIVIGGVMTIEDYAFASCEDLAEMIISDCQLEAEDNSFWGCGSSVSITFLNCTGSLGESAFSYSDCTNITIENSDLIIDEYAFASCEKISSITAEESTLALEDNAFWGCGSSANVSITNCITTIGDSTFSYSSLGTLTFTGGTITMGEYVFASCEDISTASIDCSKVILGNSCFFGCEDLSTVSICMNMPESEIEIGDSAFQYCDDLEAVSVGNGVVTVGEYAFSGCSDSLSISIAGRSYTPDSIRAGL